MKHPVQFVGAGPGAPDLITLRGMRYLAEADLVIYAGSLVNEELLSQAPDAEWVNSAQLALGDVVDKLATVHENGGRAVRLHTGDPSIYGAINEQFRELEKRGIPYEVVPGVSSVFAAAAALKTELTMPGVAQSVVLCRDHGRTPVPQNERPETYAATGATLCIYLSADKLEALAHRLVAAGKPASTPVAVVYRASWPDQEVLRGTLADIAGKAGEAHIKRQAMIVVGEVLANRGELSKLYDAGFAHGFRDAEAFQGRVALFGLTRRAVRKAAEIAAGIDGAVVFAPEKHALEVPTLRRRSYPDGEFAKAFEEAWTKFDGFILVMAAGIAVRHLARLAENKLHDPAVVVADEAGDYAVSLLGGHVAGANRLARATAKITGGKPVITTASDVRGLPAFDEIAARHRYRIVNPELLAETAAAVLEGASFEITMPPALFAKYCADRPEFRLAGWEEGGAIAIKNEATDKTLRFERRQLALGLGCRKGVSADAIEKVVREALAAAKIPLDEVTLLAAPGVKQEEPGLLEFAARLELPLFFFPTEELNAIEVPHPSETAKRELGLNSASEAAALAALHGKGKLILPKQAAEAVTVAAAEEEWI